MLVFLGQKPRCVLEIREQGDGRLARILDLIRACRISVHDLSRVTTPVRFNMPFEPGIRVRAEIATAARLRSFRAGYHAVSTRQNSE